MFVSLPVYWRFLTKTFLKTFLYSTLCTFGLALFPYSSQLASFLAAGASVAQLTIFALCNFFRVFPLVCGITTLLASFLTTYQLSETSEIISLRVAGLSLHRILTPIYYSIVWVALGSCAIAHLCTPYLRRVGAQLLEQSKSINPLILARKELLPLSKKLHVEMNLTENGTVAKEFLVAYYDQDLHTLTLLLADKLTYDKEKIIGENSALITHLNTEKEGFNHLLIANEKKFVFSNSLLPTLFTSKSKKGGMTAKAMPTPDLLRAPSFSTMKELLERISLTLLPLSFGFIGISTGLFHPKQLEEKRWYIFLATIILFFFCFFEGQRLTSKLPLALLCFLGPHAMILCFSVFLQNIYQRGRL